MTKRIYPIELLKWLFMALIAALILGYCVAWILNILFDNIPDSLYRLVPLITITYIVGYMFFRLMAHLEPYQKKPAGLQASSARTIPFNQNGRYGNLMMHVVESALPGLKNQPEPDSGPDWWRYNDIVIDEDLAYEFWRKGWNRQLLGSAHPFSENWMTRQKFYSLGMARLDSEVFKALTGLTTDYNLWLRIRRQGSSGRLRTRPGACLARLKGKW